MLRTSNFNDNFVYFFFCHRNRILGISVIIFFLTRLIDSQGDVIIAWICVINWRVNVAFDMVYNLFKLHGKQINMQCYDSVSVLIWIECKDIQQIFWNFNVFCLLTLGYLFNGIQYFGPRTKWEKNIPPRASTCTYIMPFIPVFSFRCNIV